MMRRNRKKRGVVYLVTPEAVFNREERSLKCVKIGFTGGDPNVRLRALQCGSPVTLELVGYFAATEEVEKALHATFNEMRLFGEWFDLHGKLRDFVGSFCSTPGGTVDEQELETILAETIFFMGTPYPWFSQEEWCATANHEALIPHFPELWEECCRETEEIGV